MPTQGPNAMPLTQVSASKMREFLRAERTKVESALADVGEVRTYSSDDLYRVYNLAVTADRLYGNPAFASAGEIQEALSTVILERLPQAVILPDTLTYGDRAGTFYAAIDFYPTPTLGMIRLIAISGTARLSNKRELYTFKGERGESVIADAQEWLTRKRLEINQAWDIKLTLDLSNGALAEFRTVLHPEHEVPLIEWLLMPTMM